MSDSDRDTLSGRLLPGHAIRPHKRSGGLSRAEVVAKYLEPHAQAVLDKAVDLAKQGDPASMKLILERLAPVPKQDAERVAVPGLRDAATLADKSKAILAAVADGSISAEAGEKLLRMIDVYGRAVLADTYEARLRALEGGTAPAKLSHADVVDADVIDDTAGGLL